MRIAFGMIILLAAGCASLPPPAGTDLSRQILLTVRHTETAAIGLLGAPGRRYLNRRIYSASPTVERVLSQVASEYRLRRIKGWPIPSLEVYCEVLEVPEDAAVGDALAALAADPRIDIAQRMNTFETLAGPYDDPYADLQPALRQLDIEGAHTIATGRDVLVAVIDSSVDGTHADLRGRIYFARDLIDGDREPRHGEVHGTAVAGVIASTVNNAEGIIGIAPEVEIAALRACWSLDRDTTRAQCSSFTLAQSMELVLALKPDIVNLSLAGPPDPLLVQLLDRVLSSGIVVVAAEPESPGLTGGWPTSDPRVIAAGSTHMRHDDVPARWLLAAPGDEILTTTPGSTYAFLSGNSFAAAHVTGAIALLIERDPNLDAARTAALLEDSTIRTSGFESIDACRALEQLAGPGESSTPCSRNRTQRWVVVVRERLEAQAPTNSPVR